MTLQKGLDRRPHHELKSGPRRVRSGELHPRPSTPVEVFPFLYRGYLYSRAGPRFFNPRPRPDLTPDPTRPDPTRPRATSSIPTTNPDSVSPDQSGLTPDPDPRSTPRSPDLDNSRPCTPSNKYRWGEERGCTK